MAKTETAQPDFVRIRCKSGDSFRRAGITFSRAGTDIDASTLTDEQKHTLASEPNLEIEQIEAADVQAED